MCWKENLAFIINNSEFSDRQISAWTGISTSVISNMSNQKQESLRVDQFLKLKLLFNENHSSFLLRIFGDKYFREVRKIQPSKNITVLGEILTKKFSVELISRKELSHATGIDLARIKYIITKEDKTIKIDEITKIELALGVDLGTFSKLRFPNTKLNSVAKYNTLLKKFKMGEMK